MEFYERFAQTDDKQASDNMWIEAERYYVDRYGRKMGKGEYGWVYPLITNRYGQAVKKPFFGQLIDAVDKGSKFSDIYYDVATSKSHGRFVWSPLMVRPEGRGTHVDSFSVGGIALVMELMIPQFEEILVNTSPTCTQPAHRIVMDLVKAIIKDIKDSVATIKASDPRIHGGVDV